MGQWRGGGSGPAFPPLRPLLGTHHRERLAPPLKPRFIKALPDFHRWERLVCLPASWTNPWRETAGPEHLTLDLAMASPSMASPWTPPGTKILLPYGLTMDWPWRHHGSGWAIATLQEYQ